MEARWVIWGRSAFAVGVVVVLVVLGLQNMALRPQWQEVEDGVNWAARAEGVTAVEVVPGSSGEAAGVRPGDILEAVNGLPLPQREAFLMKAEGELSLEDIAFATGTTRETVKSRLRYAQQKLREALQAWR